MEYPEISIIIPMYNAEDYIVECIDSILAQSFQDFDIFLLDDGSTDAGPEICRSRYAACPQLHLVQAAASGQNRGPSAARNLGLMLARGVYVSFVDSDDWLEPDFLRVFHEAAVGQQADVVAGGYIEHGETAESFRWIDVPRALNADRQRRLEIFCERHTMQLAWGKLYRRDFLLEHQLLQREAQPEDLLLHLQCLYYAQRYILLPDMLYNYRSTEQSLTRGSAAGKVTRAVTDAVHMMGYVEETVAAMPELAQLPALRRRVGDFFFGIGVGHLLKLRKAIPPAQWYRELHEAVEPIFGEHSAWIERYISGSCALAEQNERLKAQAGQKSGAEFDVSAGK